MIYKIVNKASVHSNTNINTLYPLVTLTISSEFKFPGSYIQFVYPWPCMFVCKQDDL